jgi:hypothetical protein
MAYTSVKLWLKLRAISVEMEAVMTALQAGRGQLTQWRRNLPSSMPSHEQNVRSDDHDYN